MTQQQIKKMLLKSVKKVTKGVINREDYRISTI